MSNTRTPSDYANQMAAIQWLGQDQKSASVLATAQRLLQAQHVLRALLPGAMGQACSVALIDGPRMTLTVPSAAHAAKLRQMGPAICRDLAAKGWGVSDIQVKIAMRPLPDSRQAQPARQTAPMGPEGLQAFSALEATLRPGPLADAVRKLLAHHR